MGRRVSLFALAALTLAAAGASAQVAEPAPGITVTGPSPKAADEARREAGAFVDASIVETRAGQVARWNDPICARSWGMPLAYNAFVVRRITEVAQQVGARADASERCRPNVLIGFTADPQALLDRIVRRQPLMLGYHYASQGRELRTVRYPVQAWYGTTTNEQLDVAGVPAPGGSVGSRLATGAVSGFAFVLILVDVDEVVGREVGPVADLLAFLALAQIPLTDQCQAWVTITNLLKPGCADTGQGLSQFDLAYLHALYATGANMPLHLQRSNMIMSMSRELTGG